MLMGGEGRRKGRRGSVGEVDVCSSGSCTRMFVCLSLTFPLLLSPFSFSFSHAVVKEGGV